MKNTALPICYFALMLGLLLSCSAPNKTTEEPKPNVVLIIVDDLGWNDLGYSGSTFYESPKIDAFSKECIQFNNAYSAGSVCSPTRASIMTGLHPTKVNITDWIAGQNPPNTPLLGPQDLNELPLENQTIAEILKAHEYSTFFAGKWHLGSEGFYPESQGFDINLGGHDKGSPPGGYYSPYKNPKLSDGPEGEYLPDRLTNETNNFINQSKDAPFFACLSYYTVHTPIQASKRHITHFEEKAKQLGIEETKTKQDRDGITRLHQNDPAYASMVYAMDENVGSIIQNLKNQGLYDNTLIIFTSDNGGLSTLESKRQRPGPTSTLPLRGGKGWLYEGGIRIPLLIKPPKSKISKPGTSDTPTASYDLLPTVLSQLSISSDIQFDGVDLTPVIQGDGPIKREYLFWDYPHYHGSGWKPGNAIRAGKWKMIQFYEDEQTVLYDLEKDEAEQDDISSEHPEVVSRLRSIAQRELNSLNAISVTKNPEYVKG